MPFSATHIVYLTTAAFAATELGLVAYLVTIRNKYNGFGNSPLIFNFILFATIWSLFSLAVSAFVARDRYSPGHRAVGPIFAWIFWCGASILIAVGVGGPYNCQGNVHCSVLEATVAFSFATWGGFTVIIFMETISAVRTGAMSAFKMRPVRSRTTTAAV